MRIVLLVSVTACALALAFAFAAADGTATPPATLVVDDDKVQCANADFESIQVAVDAAGEGAVIRVCPGIYAEGVTVDRPLKLRGDPEAVEAVDCFAAAVPLDPTRHVIVGGAGSSARDLFRLKADNIDLQGFVLQGNAPAPRPADFRLWSHGINASDAYSGYRVHHNLILGNDVGVLFRSSGVLPSSFDHNCLRENRWGLGNWFLPLVDARIHHNSTFAIPEISFDQTRTCPEFLQTGILTCPASRIGMDGVVFDHNVSRAGGTKYWFASSLSTRAFANTLIGGRVGMRLWGATQDLQIIDNHLEVQQVGLARQSNPPTPSNLRALIQGNSISGAEGNNPSMPTAGIGMGVAGLKNSSILENVISGFGGAGPFPVCSGCGIAVLAGNTDNLIRANTITNNASDGIQVAAGATGNTFEANQMLGNGRIAGVDARDDARAFNLWRGNVCLTDFPAGTICGVG